MFAGEVITYEVPIVASSMLFPEPMLVKSYVSTIGAAIIAADIATAANVSKIFFMINKVLKLYFFSNALFKN